MNGNSRHGLKTVAQSMLAVGIAAMGIGLAAGWTSHNWFTMGCGGLVIAGVVLYVKALKKQSRY